VGDELHSVDELAAIVAEAKKSGKGMRGDVLRVSGMPLTFLVETGSNSMPALIAGPMRIKRYFSRDRMATPDGPIVFLLRRAAVTRVFSEPPLAR